MANVYGISFGIDESKLRPLLHVETKVYAFAPEVPNNRHIYSFLTEKDYYDQYEQSYYAWTRKKAGWDCMRHYEIMAAGAIPYFLDLDKAPEEALHNFPRKLVAEAMALPGVGHGSIDFTIFPKEEYARLRALIRDHLVRTLLTTSIAMDVLSKLGKPSTVLYLSTNPAPNYMRCLLLSGLKKVLGAINVCDAVKVPHIYKSYPEHLTTRLYGRGFSYTRVVEEDPDMSRTPQDIVRHIESHAYDSVVYGSVHPDLPYLSLVLEHYTADKIAFVCGEDEIENRSKHVCVKTIPGYTYFMRERQLCSH